MEYAYQGEILTPSQCGRMDQGCAYGGKPILMYASPATPWHIRHTTRAAHEALMRWSMAMPSSPVARVEARLAIRPTRGYTVGLHVPIIRPPPPFLSPLPRTYDGEFLDVDELRTSSVPLHYVLVDLQGTKSTTKILQGCV